MQEARTVELSAGTVEYTDTGSGRPVVFLHGLALAGSFWSSVTGPLSGELRCVTPTLPLGGHAVPMRESADLSPIGLADLVAELLERLELRGAVVVSNDTATALAQLLVTRHPGLVGALVLTSGDAFANFLPWQVRHLQWLAHVPGAVTVVGRLLQRPWPRRSWLGFRPLTKRGLPDEVSGGFVRPLATSAGVRRDLRKVLTSISNRHTLQAAEKLGGFAGPALVVWARDDLLFPLRDGRRLAELLPGARLEVVDDSRTYLPVDQPGRLVELIRGFLATSGAPGAPTARADRS